MMATKETISVYTAQALKGYAGEEFEGLYTSPMHAAHSVGEFLASTGRTEPRNCWAGRGDTFHANGMLFRLRWNSCKYPTITRVS